MARSMGQAKAHGHSHGPQGHGGHHSIHEGGVHMKSGHHASDHMHNSHNKAHAAVPTAKGEHGGAFPQGLTEGM